MPAPESKEWQIDRVIDQLRALAGGDKPVAAQVFLHGDDKAADLAQKVRDLVDDARKSAKAESASIGHVSDLAKSFSLTAKPDVFAALAKHPAVKAILPEHIEDIFPRPTKIIRE